MDEKKWINKHRITIVQYISANSQDGKMHWIMIIKKKTMGIIFNLQNSNLLTLSLPIEEVF